MVAQLPGYEGTPPGASAKRIEIFLGFLLGIGLLLSIYLFSLSVFTDGGGFCELFQGDCRSAVQSAYGTFLSFPVAGFSCGYFVVQLGLLLQFAGAGRISLPLLRTAACLSVVAAMGSIFFLFILVAEVKEICPACLGVHGINFLVVGSLLFYTRNSDRQSTPLPSAGRQNWLQPAALCLLAGLVCFLAINLWKTSVQLHQEQEIVSKNLQFFRYLYYDSPKHSIEITAKDIVVGEGAYANHQIVLIYKDGCRFCARAKQKLTKAVAEHKLAVYLVMKNYQDIDPETLKLWGVERVPQVFIDGRAAKGWDIPGFLEEFTDDCGC